MEHYNVDLTVETPDDMTENQVKNMIHQAIRENSKGLEEAVMISKVEEVNTQ